MSSYTITFIKEQTSVLELNGSDISSKTQFAATETDIQESKIQNVIGSPCTEDSNEPKYIIPQINDMETLSDVTNRLFYKSQVWPSYHELRKNTTSFGAYWGFVDS